MVMVLCLQLFVFYFCINMWVLVTVDGDLIPNVKYDAPVPRAFAAIIDGRKTRFSLNDINYTGQIVNGSISGGRGKLTDGVIAKTFLPLQRVKANQSNWLGWFLSQSEFRAHERTISMNFYFHEDVVIKSISINALSQMLNRRAAYVFRLVSVTLKKADRRSVVEEARHYVKDPMKIGIRTENIPLLSCQPARMATLNFIVESRRLVLGEVQFEEESPIEIDFPRDSILHDPGTTFVLSCVSNKADIRIYSDGTKVDCNMMESNGSHYNCTVVKEQYWFGINDNTTYQCVVHPPNSKCQSKSKSVKVTAGAGIYAKVLEHELDIKSVANFSCQTHLFTSSISFQKLTDGDTANLFMKSNVSWPMDMTNSSSHRLSVNNDASSSTTTLTFIAVTRRDAGVYRCMAVHPKTSHVIYSQNMTLSILNEIPSMPTILTSEIIATAILSDQMTGSSQVGSILGGIIGASLLILLITVFTLIWCYNRVKQKRSNGGASVHYVPKDPFVITFTDCEAYSIHVQQFAPQGNSGNGTRNSVRLSPVSTLELDQQQRNQKSGRISRGNGQ